MKTSGLIVRLRAACPTFASRVFGVGMLSAIDDLDQVAAVPAAFVAWLDDQPGDSDTAGQVTQVVRATYAVVVVLDNTDERGQDAGEVADDLKEEIEAALVGWEPEAEHAPMQYEGGQLFNATRARHAVRFDFSTDFVIAG